jgi:soluble lytic murein transglycosylase
MLALAYDAIETDDYGQATELVAPLGVVGLSIVRWQRLYNRQGDFADYIAFIENHPDWPALDVIRARGETRISADADPQAVLDYFTDYVPDTGMGALRLSAALTTADRKPEADAVLIKAYTEFAMTQEVFAAMQARHGALLGPHHMTRADMLIWRGRYTDAGRVVPLLTGDDQLLIRARLALHRNSGATAALAAVPANLRSDPGLLYARFDHHANRRNQDEAVLLMLANSTDAASLGQPLRWSGHRRTYARQLMRDDENQRAYAAAANHHMTTGYNRNDLEWLAGYIALQKLDDPARALEHFQTFAASVDTPISLGRAGYWIGRAQDALQNPVAAQSAYVDAAEHQTSFYGLLAAERAGIPIDPSLAGTEQFSDYRTSGWITTDVAQAAILLLGAGELNTAKIFFKHVAADMARPELGQLAQLLTDLRAPHIAVIVGKTAAQRGIVLPQIYFPLHPLANMDMRIPPELALAIARRESEFDPVVSSRVGAQGLMQLMPATAREVSSNLNLPYSKSRLTRDPTYNAQLGIAYLEELQDRLGRTPAMIAAGYNAGPGRPLQWADRYGDPRAGDTDVVDWVEHIPFRETRNYVMRVTESLPVYRARLTGALVEPNFSGLLIGEKPLIRPRLRPSELPEPVVLDVVEPEQDGARPRARPGTTGPIAADEIPGPANAAQSAQLIADPSSPETTAQPDATAAPILPLALLSEEPALSVLPITTSLRPQARAVPVPRQITVRRGTNVTFEPAGPTGPIGPASISGPSGPATK